MAVRYWYNSPMRNLFHWGRNPNGDIGIEVEMEGLPPVEVVAPNWIHTVDHSLRNGGAEFVIRQPIKVDRVREVVEALSSTLKKTKIKPIFSYRTSVHLHINVQDLTFRQYVTFVLLANLFEEALVDWVSPERAGNKFCLRAVDASATLNGLRNSIRRYQTAGGGNVGNPLGLIHGDQKYAATNLMATSRFGSVEFRAMHGTLNSDEIEAWSKTLIRLKYLASTQIKNPVEIVQRFSSMGPREFTRWALEGTAAEKPLLERKDLEYILWEGLRLIQDVAYAIEWKEDIPGEIEEPQEDFSPRKRVRKRVPDWAMDVGAVEL